VVLLDPVPSVFNYARDPDDARYVDLAIASRADYLVSRDKDLLDLATSLREVGQDFRKRFPNLRILAPDDLLRELDRIPQG
jgi:predicted nucleic acid-binding protein